MCFRICSIAGAPALLEDARAAAEIMCSPFFCNHVISTPFDGVYLLGETCENCFCITEKTRKLYKDRFDTLSIPNCVIKKGLTHGARHGNTEEHRIHHMAYKTYKRCRKKKNDGFLDRFLNSPRYRASQVEHGWTEELCAKHDALAQEDRSYTYTAREHQRLASTWTVHLNSSGKTDQCQSDLVMQKLCESEIVCIKSQVKRMGEFIPVSKDDNEVTTHFWRQVEEVYVLIARRDGSGIRILLHGRLLNFCGHRPAGTDSLIIKERLQDFASRK